MSYGVPPGSLLRLFPIYVNGFADNVPADELYLYADDNTAFVIGDTTDNVIQLLNVILADIICLLCELNTHFAHKEM